MILATLNTALAIGMAQAFFIPALLLAVPLLAIKYLNRFSRHL